jgi:hypothetical protein
MRVKNTIIEGKNAKKKLKAKEDALVVIAPSINPFQKKIATSYKLNPVKPIGFIRLANWMIKFSFISPSNLNQNFQWYG